MKSTHENMKRYIIFGLLLAAAVSAAPGRATAQISWTPEKTAVWKTETTISDLVVKGDMQGAEQYIDDGWSNWTSSSSVPIPRASMMKWQGFAQGHKKTLFIGQIPVVIWVKGDFAYVYLIRTAIVEDKDGKRTVSDVRRMDALERKNGRWLVIGTADTKDPPLAKGA